MARAHPLFYVLLATLGFLFTLLVLPFWPYVVGSLLLAYVAHPIYRRIRKPFKREGGPAALALTLTLLLLVLPFSLLAWQLVGEVRSLAEGLSGEEASASLGSLANYTHTNFGWPRTVDDETAAQAFARQAVPAAKDAILDWLPSVAGFAAELVVGLTLGVFLMYYGIKDGRRLVDYIEQALPLNPTVEKNLMKELKETVTGVLLGQIATGAVIGVLGGLGFFLFGVPAPFFWGFVMAILSFVPIVGATIVWVPGAVYLFATGHIYQGIGLVAWGLLILSSVDNVVKPMVIGQKSAMHPGVALLSVVGGLVTFGVMGFVVGPLIAALLVVLINAYIDMRRLDDLPRVSEAQPMPGDDTTL